MYIILSAWHISMYTCINTHLCWGWVGGLTKTSASKDLKQEVEAEKLQVAALQLVSKGLSGFLSR